MKTRAQYEIIWNIIIGTKYSQLSVQVAKISKRLSEKYKAWFAKSYFILLRVAVKLCHLIMNST